MPSNKRRKVHVNSRSSKKKKKAVTVPREVINGVEMIRINKDIDCDCGKCIPICFPGEYNSKTGTDILVPLSFTSTNRNCTVGNGGNVAVACGNAGNDKNSSNGNGGDGDGNSDSGNVTKGNAKDGNKSCKCACDDGDGGGGDGGNGGDDDIIIICPYCNDSPCHVNQYRFALWAHYLTLCNGLTLAVRRRIVYGFYNNLQGDIPNTVVVPNCIQSMVKCWISNPNTLFHYHGQLPIGSTHWSIIDNIRNFTWEDMYNYCNQIV